jgi:Domain of unknown function (DUF4337)
MDPQEIIDTANESAEKKDYLGSWVAVTIAILAVFMGVFKIKDDNICQAMQQAQADRIDNWGWYQAHKTRVEIADATVAQLEASPTSPAQTKALSVWQKTLTDQKQKADEVKGKAETAEKLYDDLNYRDDQFDMSDGALSVSIALLAVTALTRKKWLYYFALVPTTIGLVMGIAGMVMLKIHPDALAKFLGT